MGRGGGGGGEGEDRFDEGMGSMRRGAVTKGSNRGDESYKHDAERDLERWNTERQAGRQQGAVRVRVQARHREERENSPCKRAGAGREMAATQQERNPHSLDC